ncbi:MAG: cytochrome b [Candidatus Eutrophobiaceae bacterium]
MNEQRYNNFAILIHWLMGTLLIATLCLGFYCDSLLEELIATPKPERPEGMREHLVFWITTHKSFGLTMALLALVRILWRLASPPPPLPEFVPSAMAIASSVVHWSMYAFFFIMPISGYLSSSFGGHSSAFWGLKIPDWAMENSALDEFFATIHAYSGITLSVLIAIHICAIIAHARNKSGEGIMYRMLPKLRKH